MRRTKAGTDWNSVRHYAQLHQHEAHDGPARFSTTVSEAFRAAKRAFADGTTYQVDIPREGTFPGVTLTRLD